MLNELGHMIVDINSKNGWNELGPDDWEDDNRVPAILALIHSEVSEALEAFRDGDIVGFEEELADVIIRVLDSATGLGLDMDKAVQQKLEHNKTRGYRHGGKRI